MSSDEQPCPVHPWDYAIPTFPNPLLALQQKPLPNLPTLLELQTLLCDQSLLIPMNAHYELHSPILHLYKLYCFIMGLNDHLQMEKIKRPAESGLVHVLYQLEVLTLMKTLKQAPQKHGRRTFCSRCYQLGQIKMNCRYYQCPHCSLYRPHHNKDQCLENPWLFDRENVLVKEESQSPPPLWVPPPQIIRKPHFPPRLPLWHDSKSLNLSKSSSSNGINKQGQKQKRKEIITAQESLDRDLVRGFEEMWPRTQQFHCKICPLWWLCQWSNWS